MYKRSKVTKRKNSKHKNSKHKNSKKLMRKQSKHKHSNKHYKHKGGYGAGAGPLGYAWVGKDMSTWPGVAGVPGQSNFLPLSKLGVPTGGPELPENTSEANLVNSMQGGGIIPQDLVNFGRSLTGGVQGLVYGYNGVERPYSTYPLPTTQNLL